MSYKMFRVLAAVFALALVYIGIVSRIRQHEQYYYPLFLLFGFQALVALGLGTVCDDGGWRLRFLPITLCLTIDGGFFLWDAWPISRDHIVENLMVLPPIWLMLSAIFDLSGQPATNPLLRGYRRTANLLRSPVLFVAGSILVIYSILFGKNWDTWITSSEYISWNADAPTAIRNYAGLGVFFALVAAAGVTLLALAILAVRHNSLPKRLLGVAGFVVFALCAYAAIDAAFAAYGLLLSDSPGTRELYIVWAIFAVLALAYAISDLYRFGRVRQQTMMAFALLMAPPLQLAFQLCVGFMHEDSWVRGDAFTTFYPGVGLLLWAFARRVSEVLAQQPLDTLDAARPKSLAVTA